MEKAKEELIKVLDLLNLERQDELIQNKHKIMETRICR